MEKRITSIRYNAYKIESAKGIIVTIALVVLIIYLITIGQLKWDKDSIFFYALVAFGLFTSAILIKGSSKEKIKVLSASNWKYRLYKRKGVVAYFIVRGVITSLLAITLFSLLMLRKDALNALSQKSNILLYSFLLLILIAGVYHTLTIRYIFRNGTPVYDNVE